MIIFNVYITSIIPERMMVWKITVCSSNRLYIRDSSIYIAPFLRKIAITRVHVNFIANWRIRHYYQSENILRIQESDGDRKRMWFMLFILKNIHLYTFYSLMTSNYSCVKLKLISPHHILMILKYCIYLTDEKNK